MFKVLDLSGCVSDQRDVRDLILAEGTSSVWLPGTKPWMASNTFTINPAGRALSTLAMTKACSSAIWRIRCHASSFSITCRCASR